MFKGISLAKKIAGGFAVILVLLVLLAVAGRMGLTRVVDRVAAAGRFQAMANLILDARQNEKQFILTNDAGTLEKVKTDITAIKAEISKIAGANGKGELKKSIRRIEDGLEAYGGAVDQYADMARQKDSLMTGMDDKAGSAMEIATKIRDEQKAGYDALMEESDIRMSQMRIRVGAASRIQENFLQAGGYRMVLAGSADQSISMVTQWKRYHANIKKELDGSASMMDEETAKTWHSNVGLSQEKLIEAAETYFRKKTADNNKALIKASQDMERAVTRFSQELQELLEFYIEDVRILSGQIMALSSGADQVANTLLGVRILEKEFIRNEDPELFQQITEKLQGIDQGIPAIKEAIDDPEKTQVLDGIQAAVDDYARSFKAYARLMGEQQAAKSAMEKTAAEVQAACLREKDGMEKQMAGQITTSTAVITAVSLIAVAAGFIIALVLARMIIGPIRQVVEALKDIAQGEGDLTRRIDIDTRDEIGDLAKWFNRFISRLNHIIVDIGTNSETVTAASGELLTVSETMAEDSGDLAQRSNSVAAAADQMSSGMTSVAAASEQAAGNLATVAEAAGQMKLTLNEVAVNCDRARSVSENAEAGAERATLRVGRLGDSARDITAVTEVITDIAEQTNLLALNATIEAARAGEAGKGFAVVANEIKGLAAQTADATKDIKEKIQGIRSASDDTVKDVEEINRVISEVREIVSAIAAAIEEQSAAAAQVAENIEQASGGIGEVNENVAQNSLVSSEIAQDISRVKDVSDGMTEQSGRMKNSARELAELSGRLRDMIGVFKVAAEGSATLSPSAVSSHDIPDLMPWGERMMIGLSDVDEQHRELVAMVNELHRAMKLKAGAREAGQILKRLADYTVYHFGFEEELFDAHGYPETDAHKKIHQDLVAKVVEIQEDFNQGKAALSMELMEFLTRWLREHILKTDKAYVPFFKEKGLS
ncbi:MAG: bacteriohemerythrin [Desulfobacter sp.]|nr:MAG: bacteriohemerythrin [Desulfobacter sp.]